MLKLKQNGVDRLYLCNLILYILISLHSRLLILSQFRLIVLQNAHPIIEILQLVAQLVSMKVHVLILLEFFAEVVLLSPQRLHPVLELIDDDGNSTEFGVIQFH